MPVELPPEDQDNHDSTGPVGIVYQNDSEDPVNEDGGGTVGLRPEEGSLLPDHGLVGDYGIAGEESPIIPIVIGLVVFKYIGVI